MFTFYLMTEKGYQVLYSLVHNNYTPFIDQVVCAEDKSVQKDFFSEIKDLCSSNHIPFYERKQSAKPLSKYCFAISWRWLIDIPNLIVLHDSILPRYRGFSPLVTALINGDKHIGVTALLANKEFDRGDIVAQKAIEIVYPIEINNAIKAIATLYVDIVFEIIKNIIQTDALTTYSQDETAATYSLWRDDEDYKIEWEKESFFIERFINAVGFPYKGASTTIDEKVVRIKKVEQIKDVHIENRTPGKVIFMDAGLPVVVCGKGLLKIKEMIWENGMNALPLKKFRMRFRN